MAIDCTNKVQNHTKYRTKINHNINQVFDTSGHSVRASMVGISTPLTSRWDGAIACVEREAESTHHQQSHRVFTVSTVDLSISLLDFIRIICILSSISLLCGLLCPSSTSNSHLAMCTPPIFPIRYKISL